MKNLPALDHQEIIEALNDKIDAYGPFSKLFNERNELVARPSGISYSFLLGGTTIGKPLRTYSNAMTAVYSW